MSAGAILMMLLAMVVLWGGLGAAVVNLNRSDDGEVQEPHRDL
jgi:hypothetical protein